MSDSDRRAQGAKLLEEMLGVSQADDLRGAWRELCPDLEEYIVDFVAGDIWSRPGLDRRTKSLVTIATLAGLGRTLALELNLRMAVANGATRQEIVEALLQIAPYAGFPAVWEALSVARRVLGEED